MAFARALLAHSALDLWSLATIGTQEGLENAGLKNKALNFWSSERHYTCIFG